MSFLYKLFMHACVSVQYILCTLSSVCTTLFSLSESSCVDLTQLQKHYGATVNPSTGACRFLRWSCWKPSQDVWRKNTTVLHMGIVYPTRPQKNALRQFITRFLQSKQAPVSREEPDMSLTISKDTSSPTWHVLTYLTLTQPEVAYSIHVAIILYASIWNT